MCDTPHSRSLVFVPSLSWWVVRDLCFGRPDVVMPISAFVLSVPGGFTEHEEYASFGPACSLVFAPSRRIDVAVFARALLPRYQWLTYDQVGQLATQVAKGMRAVLPYGAHVGICGFNSFEWSICDFASALAGCVTVGLHTTYSCVVGIWCFVHRLVLALVVTTQHRCVLVPRAERKSWRRWWIIPK